MDDPHPDFGGGELFKRLLDGFGGALNVGLDDEGQLLDLALLDLAEEVFEGDLLVGLELLFLLLGAALFDQLAGEALVLDGVEDVARCGDLGHAGDLDRDGGAGFGDNLPAVVAHLTDAADRGAGDDDVAGAEGAVLDKEGGDRTAAPVEAGFDDGALAQAVGVGLQLLHVGDEEDVFEQLLDAHAGRGRNGDADDVAAPVVGDELIFGQLLLDLVGVRFRLIHLVDGDDDRDAGGLGVVDGLNGLGHDAVVRCDDEDGDVGDGRAAGAHGGEGLMAGGVEEGDIAAADFDAVCADVLGDAAGLGVGDAGVADAVKEGGLAVVDVAHNDDDRASLDEILARVLLIVDELLLDGDDDLFLNLRVIFHCDEGGGVKVDDFVLGSHDPHEHQLFDDVGNGDLQAGSELGDGDFVGDEDLELLLARPLEGETLELFGLGLPLVGEFGLVFDLGFLFELLLALLGIAAAVRLRGDLLVMLVVLVEVDLDGAGVDVADGALLLDRLSGLLRSGGGGRFGRAGRGLLGAAVAVVTAVVPAAVAVFRASVLLGAAVAIVAAVVPVILVSRAIFRTGALLPALRGAVVGGAGGALLRLGSLLLCGRGFGRLRTLGGSLGYLRFGLFRFGGGGSFRLGRLGLRGSFCFWSLRLGRFGLHGLRLGRFGRRLRLGSGLSVPGGEIGVKTRNLVLLGVVFKDDV